MNGYKIIKNDYYEFIYDEKYEKEVIRILNYSTRKLKENLDFFGTSSYGEIIKVSFFDNREDFFKRIYEISPSATPPAWAKGCFYGNENQVLFLNGNINSRFFTPAHESCHLLFYKYVYSHYKHLKRLTWLDEAFAVTFSGEVDNHVDNGKFLLQITKYIGVELPNLNDIKFENNNVKTDTYDAYDFFYIVGKYLQETMSKNELLSLFMDEERVFMLGNTVLNDSLDYFVSKYKLSNSKSY